VKRPPVSANHPSRHQIGAAPQPPHPSRTLHLVDVDNLLGDPRVTDAGRIALVFDTYRRAAMYTNGDHAVVATGCDARHVLEVELGWPTARHCRRVGRNGADLALLEEAQWAATSQRYARVVLGSGDGIFLTAFDLLRAVNIPVDIVCQRRSLSRALGDRASGHVTFLSAA
jgi:hypothetical protein